MKKLFEKYKYLLGVITSATFFYLAVKDIDWEKLFLYFSADHIQMVVYIFVVNVILRFILALRWHKLLDIVPDNKFITTFNYTNIGYFANNFLPARLGDIIKSYLFAKKKEYNKTQIFTSAIIERIFDLIGLSVLFIIAIFRYDIPEDIMRGGIIFIVILLFATIVVLIMMKKMEFIDLKLSSISKFKFIGFIRRKIKMIFKYLQNYLNIKDLTFLIVTTAVIWFLYAFAGFLIVDSLSGRLSWDASILSLIFLGVSFILPSTPGNLGVHQFACVLAFAILGLDKTQAVAFSFYYQIPVIVISTIFGFISIYYEGFSIKGISRVSKEAKSAGLNEVG